MEAHDITVFEREKKTGIKEGIKEGELYKLINLVSKKINKGYQASAIADMLEEPPEFIEAIVRALEKYDSKDLDRVYEVVKMESPSVPKN